MKTYYYFGLLLGLLVEPHTLAGGLGAGDWGAPTNQLQMSIDLKQGGERTSTNQPVVLLIRIRNLSSKDTVHFQQPHFRQPGEPERASAFSFLVVTPSRKAVTLTVEEPLHSGGQFVFVGPGETREIDFDLSKLCKFDESGTYQIVSRCLLGRWLDREGKTVKAVQVISNPLRVSIGPAD
jgi:hypothetical protein